MYELALLGAALLFALLMLTNQQYQKMSGSGLAPALRSSLWSSAMGFIVPIITQGLHLEFTWFSLLIALWSTVNGIIYTICSLRALETANLSVFTTFSMLGSVFIPFIGGILIWNEDLTWQKAVCCLFLAISILCNVRLCSKTECKGPSPLVYYFAIFIFNGMGGLINKVHQSFPDLAVDSGSFSVWTRIVAIVLCGGILLLKKQPLLLPFVDRKECALGWSNLALCALLGLSANWILLVALLHVDASISYTLTTGATIVFSTLISLLRKEKIGRRQLLAVLAAFLGLLCLAL